MSDRPTPRTASAMMELPGRWNSVWVVPAEIACDLESELNDAISERDKAREAFVIATDQMVIAQCKLREANKERDEWAAMCGRYKQERDDTREKLNEAIELLGRAAVYSTTAIQENTEKFLLKIGKSGEAKCPVCTPEQKCWECANDVSQEGVE
jgi:hypothetical protein